jgi:NAD(P)-dependent dehydrogenase (short-subunit alcohol dehydrogenase family)
MMDINEKVGVVTGAGSGIGRETAKLLSKHGMVLVLADIDESALKSTVKEIVAMGGQAIGVVTDVSKLESIEKLAEVTIATYGRVNLLHNNAGVVTSGTLDDLTINDWKWTLSTNLWSNIYGVKVFLPLIKEANEGHIIFTSSSEGLQASAGTGAYSVSKFGIVGLAETLSNELMSFSNINASVLCPGPVRTNIIASERYRPEEFLNGSKSELGLLSNELSQDLLADAMSPHIVAEMVVDAVLKNRFWIITHEVTRLGFLSVARCLAEDGSLAPSTYDFSKSS